MNIGNKYIGIRTENDISAPLKCVGEEKPSQHVLVEFHFLCFSLEIWCLDTAGYGAAEFRWNKYWFTHPF